MEVYYSRLHTLSSVFLQTAVSIRREVTPQPHDAFDLESAEMERIRTEFTQKSPRQGVGYVATANVPNLAGPRIGYAYAHELQTRRFFSRQRFVEVGGICVRHTYRGADVALGLAHHLFESFDEDLPLTNAEETMPPLLSGALDDSQDAGSLMYDHIPRTVGEAREAVEKALIRAAEQPAAGDSWGGW
ncbi:MAG TPA: hypothetical protein VJR27_02200 [Candidatus Saccharimonadales bacterium]|nr:hypothetical protein [Candidatus Saccharimonadales bacterium]